MSDYDGLLSLLSGLESDLVETTEHLGKTRAYLRHLVERKTQLEKDIEAVKRVVERIQPGQEGVAK